VLEACHIAVQVVARCQAYWKHDSVLKYAIQLDLCM